ncbi:MAG: hypothetical protein IKZ60_08965 [Bacteroidales bacterium]|nr:hypothetical protein [Bacteroidales bacterium]
MKKLAILTLALIGMISCSRDYNYIDRGFDGNSSYTGAYVRAYIQQVSDNLIVQNLQVLEKVIALNANNIWAVGNEYTYNNELDIRGVVIRKTDADSTWTLSRSGDYPINDVKYPTDYVITAKMSVGKGGANHYDWTLTLEGTRTEDNGFGCSFSSDGAILYKSSYSSYNKWSYINGIIRMFVTKNGEEIDKAILDFRGDPNNPFYANLR